MKAFKRIFVFILVMALCAAFIPAAYAKNDKHGNDNNKNGKQTVLSADVQKLVELGLLTGSGKDGVTNAYAKSKPTRIQAFIVYLRLIGESQKLDAFLYHDGDRNFDDHHGHSPFVQKGMGFAKAHPEYNWIGSNGKFNPMAHLTAKEYAKVLLAALGYTIPEDFTWKTVESFAKGLGLNIPKGAFTFEAFATMTVQALDMYIKGSTTEKLIDRLGITPTTDTVKPTVTDVVLSASYVAGPHVLSGQVTVYFSEAMNAETLKNAANYTVDLDGSAAAFTSTQLSLMAGASAVQAADRKSVTLTIPGSALSGGTSAGAGVTDITISGLKDTAGNILDTVTAYLRKADSLTVTSTPAAIDLDKLQVAFSNPMKTIDASEFRLYKPDGVTLASVGTGYTLDATGKLVTITLSNSLTPDAKTAVTDTAGAKLAIGTANTKDIFGNAVSGDLAVPAVSAATPAAVTILDKIVPAVAALTKGTEPYTFEMTFTEPVGAADLAALTGALKIMSTGGAAQTAAYSFSGAGGTVGSFTKLTAAITGAYENKYMIELLGQGLKDASGNIVKAFAKTTLTVVTNSLPVLIQRETQDLDKDGYLDAVKLTFNKNIKDSTVIANDFDVAGYDFETFTPATAGDAADNQIIYITFQESVTPDTFVTPAITYTQGTLEDSAGNKLASTGVLSTTDKAAPAVITALPIGVLTAGGAVSSAALVLSEDLTAAAKTAVLTAVHAHITLSDLVTAGDLVATYVWTTNRLLTVSVTANANDGTNPDSIALTAANAELADAAGNTAAAAQIIK